ncbi:MAG: carbamoyltransferase HypF [Candidatus Ranarchaeia archaeon]
MVFERAIIRVSGIVQGVGFRPFVYRAATELGLSGTVQNLGDAEVEIILEGTRQALSRFMYALRRRSPPLAQIESVSKKTEKAKGLFVGVKILPSSKTKKGRGSLIPPDIGLCEACEKELYSRNSRRQGYYFITCTDCGPRFTTIRGVPYDRKTTTLDEFILCDSCLKEYNEPLDRRFHAQTIACHRCGPRLWLEAKDGSPIEDEPIITAAKLINEGAIIAIKGYGGYHLAAKTTDDTVIKRLREKKRRPSKPFALMARSIEKVRLFSDLTKSHERILINRRRPIVLVPILKKTDTKISRLIAPKLDRIGVMLPYAGLHYLLLDHVNDPAIILTSGNESNHPIIVTENEAHKKLADVADYFLIHERKIAQRCDDSVVRLVDKQPTFIRRSRGYVPQPIKVPLKTDKCVLGVGGEFNVAGSIYFGQKIVMTQHIGNLENRATRDFLAEALTHLQKILQVTPKKIVHDLHPKFVSTHLAKQIADTYGLEIEAVQHHKAHAAALAMETGNMESVIIVCDGFGLGDDGKAWGGEIFTFREGQFKRAAHLEEIPLIGGDLAAVYPLRLVAAALIGVEGIAEFIYDHSSEFPHGIEEANLVLNEARRRQGILTTSCGRVLDAASSILGICNYRSYDGEPAMHLEAAARGGRMFPLTMSGDNRYSYDNVIPTRPLLSALWYQSQKNTIALADLAYSFQVGLATAIGDKAVQIAEHDGIDTVGMSGGVAFNDIIVKTIKSRVLGAGLQWIQHRQVPPGDGGLAFGQVVLAGSDWASVQ